MNDSPAPTDQMILYLDALLDDPQAVPPPDLSAADVDFVRALLRLYPVPVQSGERRRRVWQRVIAQAVAQRVSTPLTKNGRQTLKEFEMVTYQTPTRPQSLRGVWTLGLTAAAVIVVAVTLLLAYENGTPPERGANSGAGIITLSPQASGTALPPTASPTYTATPLVPPDVTPISPAPDMQIVTATPFPGAPSPVMPGSTALPPTLGSPVPEVPNMVVEAEVVPSPVPAPLLPPHAAEVLTFAPGEVAALAWSPDGQFLAAAYADRIDLRTMHDPTAPGTELNQAGAAALAFSSDSRWLASAHDDGTASLWDPFFTQGEPLVTLNIAQTALVKVSFSPNGAYLTLETVDGEIHVWSLTTDGPVFNGSIPPREGDPVTLWGCSTTFNGGTPPQSRPLDAYTIVSTPDTHDGIDLAATSGIPVLAAGAGTVLFAGWNDSGYGNTVVIAHGDTFSLYAHLAGVVVECGQKVSEGEPIGTVGSTGQASGPVLHFEIRDAAWTPLDPNKYLAF